METAPARTVGIDPGLAQTGLALVRGRDELGPRATIRIDGYTGERHRVMAREILVRIGDWQILHGTPELVVIEWFAHQGWRGRRIDTGPEMGALVESLRLQLERHFDVAVTTVDPATSKAGYPAGERDRARILPAQLRNRHERDAYLAAVAGRTLYVQAARATRGKHG